MLTKKLSFDPQIVQIISGMRWEPRGAEFAGALTCGQLDRRTYEAVNKALDAMGGKWNRKAQAHLFPFDPRSQVDGLLDNGSLTIERDGYFPTPDPIGQEMARMACITPGMAVLEPSAGTGELAAAILKVQPACVLSVIEKNERRAAVLRQKGYRLIGWDFLEHHGQWARIIQNPPFEEGQDIDHVCHAFDCLEPGGRLVSVMSEGAFFRGDHKATRFRDWLNDVGGYDSDLPAGSFVESGSGVNARLVVIDKPGRLPERIVVSLPQSYPAGEFVQAALWTALDTAGESG